MVGGWMLGRQCKGSGETCRLCASPAGVRARIVPMRSRPNGSRKARAAKPGRGKAGQEGGDVTTMTEARAASGVPATAAHGAEARPLIAGAEASVWTERMLSALVNGVKGGKWFSLMDKVFAPKTLAVAWTKVRANKGAAGVDGQSIGQVRSEGGGVSGRAVNGAAGRNVSSAGRQTGGDPEGRWQDEAAGHSDGQGSHRPAGGAARRLNRYSRAGSATEATASVRGEGATMRCARSIG